MDTKFGDTIKALRVKKDLKLKDVAEALECSVSYLSDVESSRRAPFNRTDIIKVAKRLGVPARRLLSAAAITKGHYELPVLEDEKSQEAGSLLQSKWRKMTSKQFSTIIKLLED